MRRRRNVPSEQVAMRSLVSVLAALSLAGLARADVVTVTGRPAAVGVTIVELKGGDLIYRLANGEEIARHFAEVEYLQVTGWSAVNAGDKARREGRLAEAASKYEAALAELSFSGGRPLPGRDRLDRGLLARCRLAQVYDAAGQFDRALDVYLAVLDGPGGAGWVEPLRPAHLPDASWNWDGARALLDRCIQRHEGDPVAISLKAWREAWPKPVASRAAGSQLAAATSSIRKQDLEAIRKLVEGGRFDEALGKVSTLQKAAPAAPELFYWQGRALEERALKASTAAEDASWARAGLAYMRVVIHAPDHELAAESLCRAAGICERSGDRSAAERLRKELLARYPQSGRWAEQARKALGQ